VLVAACGSSARDDLTARENRTGITEIEYRFVDAHGAIVTIDPDQVRRALEATGAAVYDCRADDFADDAGVSGPATLVRVPLAKQDPAAEEDVIATLRRRFATIGDATWGGDRLYLRSSAPLPEPQLGDILDRAGFSIRTLATADDGTSTISVVGAEARYTRTLSSTLGVTAIELDAQSVGPGGIR